MCCSLGVGGSFSNSCSSGYGGRRCEVPDWPSRLGSHSGYHMTSLGPFRVRFPTKELLDGVVCVLDERRMASQQSRVALLSAEFEQLVVEYNKLLGEGRPLLSTAVDAT